MRRLRVMTVVAVMAFTGLAPESPAGCRKRHARCCMPCCPAYVPACPGAIPPDSWSFAPPDAWSFVPPPSAPVRESAPAAPQALSPARRRALSSLPREVLTSRRGTTYRVYVTNEIDHHEDNEPMPLRARAFRGTAAAVGTGDDYLGHDRAASKTSIAPAPVEVFGHIDRLLDTLPSDDTMRNNPGITEAEDSRRVPEEDRNVTVDAFLYATSKEKDNDFHLILGDGDTEATGRFLTAEVSGLPESEPLRSELTVPRDQFKEHFGGHTPGRKYVVFEHPTPVRVSGSLFFDLDHLPGEVGPTGFKPQTSWEIHPVTQIEFLPP